MKQKDKSAWRILMLAFAIEGSVLLAWLAWGYCLGTGVQWNFDALNTLFSGLAFGGLIVTLLSQHREAQEQDKAAQETIGTFRSIAEVLALDTIRRNLGSRIDHLKRELEIATARADIDKHNAEIADLRDRIPEIEERIRKLLERIAPPKMVPNGSASEGPG